MIATMLIINHAKEIRGEELDQVMVSLYQAFREQFEMQQGRYQPVRLQNLSSEQRMERFREWLERLVRQTNPELENMKTQNVFRRELPELRRIWDQTMGVDSGSVDSGVEPVSGQ